MYMKGEVSTIKRLWGDCLCLLMQRSLNAIRKTSQLVESLPFDMSGWYTNSSDGSIYIGEDMKISDRMLNRLKACGKGD
jgi:hypothetical protein